MLNMCSQKKTQERLLWSGDHMTENSQYELAMYREIPYYPKDRTVTDLGYVIRLFLVYIFKSIELCM